MATHRSVTVGSLHHGHHRPRTKHRRSTTPTWKAHPPQPTRPPDTGSPEIAPDPPRPSIPRPRVYPSAIAPCPSHSCVLPGSAQHGRTVGSKPGSQHRVNEVSPRGGPIASGTLGRSDGCLSLLVNFLLLLHLAGDELAGMIPSSWVSSFRAIRPDQISIANEGNS